MPYFEFAVSDLNEKHVALFQRFKQHWLIHCGSRHDTTAAGKLTAKQIVQLATLAASARRRKQRGVAHHRWRELEKMLG